MQKDLFGGPEPAVPPSPLQKSDFLDCTRISLRLDQTVIVLIALLGIYVLVFSFGVETGKRYAMAELKAERAKREKMVEELREKIFANNNNQVPEPITENEKITAQNLTPKTDKQIHAAAASKLAVPVEAKTDAVDKPSGKYTIQVITFTSQAFASKELKKFSHIGQKGFVISKGKYLHVCVGGFESRQKAIQLLTQLKEQGMAPRDAYVRPLGIQAT